VRGVLRDVHLTALEAWTAADDREGWRAQRSCGDDDDDDDDDAFIWCVNWKSGMSSKRR